MSIVIEKKDFPFNGDPFDVFAAFRHEPHAFFLDSSLRHPSLGRYSFVGFDPFRVIRAVPGDDFTRLKKCFCRYAPSSRACPYPFPGGMLGYVSYDFNPAAGSDGRMLRKSDPRVPGYVFGCYDAVIMIDHAARRLTVLSTGFPHTRLRLRRRRARVRLKNICAKLDEVPNRPAAGAPSRCPLFLSNETAGLKSNFTKAQYQRAVRRALDYIRRGDIYQVNLSQCFSLNGRDRDAVEVYGALRTVFPSCFSGYFDAGDFQIISSSPERFLRMRGGLVETRPMKGTRPRGRTPAEDRFQARQLMKSRKDQAELLMITDLERNDLGRVCRYGSVRVREMRALETYATVYQTTATVTGRLDAGRDAWDLLSETFPGGSITGCPKIRAMQIIDELEPTPRSVYTGILGYAGFQGDMDFNILIRTFLKYGARMYFQAGGGIVADSDPQAEYEETLVKARALKECLGLLKTREAHAPTS